MPFSVFLTLCSLCLCGSFFLSLPCAFATQIQNPDQERCEYRLEPEQEQRPREDPLARGRQRERPEPVNQDRQAEPGGRRQQAQPGEQTAVDGESRRQPFDPLITEHG